MHSASFEPEGLKQYDHLPPDQAIVRAWTEGGPSPRWHALAIRDVVNVMPLLARAVERLVERAEQQQQVIEALSTLDGTMEARVSLLTGIHQSDVDRLAGHPDQAKGI
jgi:hypothetical protein